MPPSKFPVTLYVGDSRTWDLTDLTVDGAPVDLSDGDLYAVTGSIRADRDPDTPVTAVLEVTFPTAGTTRVRLTPDESEKLRPLLNDAEPTEGTTALTVAAAIDVQVDVLADGVVVDRTTLLSGDAKLTADVTR